MRRRDDHGDDESAENPVANFKVVVTFEDRAGQDDAAHIVDSGQQLEAMKKFGAVAGGV